MNRKVGYLSLNNMSEMRGSYVPHECVSNDQFDEVRYTCYET